MAHSTCAFHLRREGFNFGKADAIYTAVLVDLDHLDSKTLDMADWRTGCSWDAWEQELANTYKRHIMTYSY